ESSRPLRKRPECMSFEAQLQQGRIMKHCLTAMGALGLALAAPAAAQDAGTEPSVFDGDYLAVGLGAGYQSSYIGSDDYILFPTGVLQGSLYGVGISSRMNGIALDFVPNPPGKVGLNLGIVG